MRSGATAACLKLPQASGRMRQGGPHRGVEPTQSRAHNPCMVARLLALLAMLAYVLALALPIAPASAGAGIGSMPCHEDAVPATDAAPGPPRCCVPVCCAVAAFDPEPNVRARPMAPAADGVKAFTSVSTRPLLPPPRA